MKKYVLGVGGRYVGQSLPLHYGMPRSGVIAGLVLGHGVLALTSAKFAQLRDFGFDPLAMLPGEWAIMLVVLGIGFAAALVPAIRVFRLNLSDTLSRSS